MNARLWLPMLAPLLAPLASCADRGHNRVADLRAKYPAQCTIMAMGEKPIAGLAVYRIRTAAEAKKSATPIPAFTLACGSSSNTADRVTLILPNLRDTFETGEYRVIDPARPYPDSISPYRVALAVLQRTPVAPVEYYGRVGSIKILSLDGDTIKGAYLIGFSPAKSNHADTVVVGGGFTAPPTKP